MIPTLVTSTIFLIQTRTVTGNCDRGHDSGYIENGFDDSGMFLDSAGGKIVLH